MVVERLEKGKEEYHSTPFRHTSEAGVDRVRMWIWSKRSGQAVPGAGARTTAEHLHLGRTSSHRAGDFLTSEES